MTTCHYRLCEATYRRSVRCVATHLHLQIHRENQKTQKHNNAIFAVIFNADSTQKLAEKYKIIVKMLESAFFNSYFQTHRGKND